MSPGIEKFDHEALLSVIDAIVIMFVGRVAVGTRGLNQACAILSRVVNDVMNAGWSVSGMMLYGIS